MGIIKDLRNKRIISEINRLNNNMLEGSFQPSGVYKGSINLDYDKIRLPKNFTKESYLYNDDGTLRMFIHVPNKYEDAMAVIECLQNEEMKKENERKIALKNERLREKREQEAKEAMERYEEMKMLQGRLDSRCDRYINFLKENNVNEEILNLSAIQDLIESIMARGDIRVISEGRSPIEYNKPKPDGTFDLYGRTNGPVANEIYEMSYCDDGNEDHFIKLERKQQLRVSYAMDDPIGGEPSEVIDTTTTYINRAGEVVDESTVRKSK